jgi:hypothetical protein
LPLKPDRSPPELVASSFGPPRQFEYSLRYRLGTPLMVIAMTAFTVWAVVWSASSAGGKLSAILVDVPFLALAYLWFRSPIRIQIDGADLIGQYYGGRSKTWRLADLSIAEEPGIMSNMFGAHDVCIARNGLAFRVWSTMLGFETMVKQLETAQPE